MIRPAALLLTAFLLAGHVPNADAADRDRAWSQIRLPAAKAANPHEYRVTMLTIDGKNVFLDESEFDLVPGHHEFLISTTKPATGAQLRDDSQRVYTLEMRPCMSYALVAVHTPSIHNREWTPTLRAEKPIPHCVEKFGAESDGATP